MERELLPEEHVGVMGVPIVDVGDDNLPSHFPVLKALRSGQLSAAAQRHLAGNGMDVRCAAAALLSALGACEFADA